MFMTLIKKLLGFSKIRSNESTSQAAADLPTEKQVVYARKLGIAVAGNMTRRQLSIEIATAEARSPKISAMRKRQAQKLEAEERKRQESPAWRELVKTEAEWTKHAESDAVLLLRWRQKKKNMIDVVMLDCVEIDDSDEPFVALTFNRPEKSRQASEFDTIDWGREFSVGAQDVISVQVLEGVDCIELQWKEYKAILAAVEKASDS